MSRINDYDTEHAEAMALGEPEPSTMEVWTRMQEASRDAEVRAVLQEDGPLSFERLHLTLGTSRFVWGHTGIARKWLGESLERLMLAGVVAYEESRWTLTPRPEVAA
jgi:hypothetical protein